MDTGIPLAPEASGSLVEPIGRAYAAYEFNIRKYCHRRLFRTGKRLFCLTTEDSQDNFIIEQRANCLYGSRMTNLVAPDKQGKSRGRSCRSLGGMVEMVPSSASEALVGNA